jgi:hypothetical protein
VRWRCLFRSDALHHMTASDQAYAVQSTQICCSNGGIREIMTEQTIFSKKP